MKLFILPYHHVRIMGSWTDTYAVVADNLDAAMEKIEKHPSFNGGELWRQFYQEYEPGEVIYLGEDI